MILSSVKAAIVATIAGGSVSVLAATTTEHIQWLDFIKTVGVPTALALFFSWAWWEAIKRQNVKNDERDVKYDAVQVEFRNVLSTQIASSNQLHRDTNAILIEQNKTLAKHGDTLDAQTHHLREISQKISLSGPMPTVRRDT